MDEYAVVYMCLPCYLPRGTILPPPTGDHSVPQITDVVKANLMRWCAAYKRCSSEVARNFMYRETTAACSLKRILSQYTSQRKTMGMRGASGQDQKAMVDILPQALSSLTKKQTSTILKMASEVTTLPGFGLVLSTMAPSSVMFCANTTLNLEGSFFAFFQPLMIIPTADTGPSIPEVENAAYRAWSSWMLGRYESRFTSLGTVGMTAPLRVIFSSDKKEQASAAGGAKKRACKSHGNVAVSSGIFNEIIQVHPGRLDISVGQLNTIVSDITAAFNVVADYALDVVGKSAHARRTMLPLEFLASAIGRNFGGGGLEHSLDPKHKLVIAAAATGSITLARGQFTISSAVLRNSEASSTPSSSALGGAHFDIIQDLVARESCWDASNASVLDVAIGTSFDGARLIPFVGWVIDEVGTTNATPSSVAVNLARRGMFRPGMLHVAIARAGQDNGNPPTMSAGAVPRQSLQRAPAVFNYPAYARQARVASVNATFDANVALDSSTYTTPSDEDLVRRTISRAVFGSLAKHATRQQGGVEPAAIRASDAARVDSIRAQEQASDERHNANLAADDITPGPSAMNITVFKEGGHPAATQVSKDADKNADAQYDATKAMNSVAAQYTPGDFIASSIKRASRFNPTAWKNLDQSISALAEITSAVVVEDLDVYWRNLSLILPTNKYTRADLELQSNILTIVVNLVRQTQTLHPLGGVNFVYPTRLLDISSPVSVTCLPGNTTTAKSLRCTSICKALFTSQYRGGNATNSGFPVSLPFVVTKLSRSTRTGKRPSDILPISVDSSEVRSSSWVETTRVTRRELGLSQNNMYEWQQLLKEVCDLVNEDQKLAQRFPKIVSIPGMETDSPSSTAQGKIVVSTADQSAGGKTPTWVARQYGPSRMTIGQRAEFSLADAYGKQGSSTFGYDGKSAMWIGDDCTGMDRIIPVYATVPLDRSNFREDATTLPSLDNLFGGDNSQYVLGVVRPMIASTSCSRKLSLFIQEWSSPPTETSSLVSFYQSVSIITNIVGALAYLNARGASFELTDASQVSITRHRVGMLNDFEAVDLRPDFEAVNLQSVRSIVEMMRTFMVPVTTSKGRIVSCDTIMASNLRHHPTGDITPQSTSRLISALQTSGIHSACIMLGITEHAFASTTYERILSVIADFAIDEGADPIMAIYQRMVVLRLQCMNACSLPW